MTDTGAPAPVGFEYRHTVAFAETDLCGRVDHVTFTRWQARCQELFLREHAPGVLCDEIDGPRLFTQQVECELLAPVAPLDEIRIRLTSADVGHTGLELAFDHVRTAEDGTTTLTARGRQRIVCMSGRPGEAVPTFLPDALVRALEPYRRASDADPAQLIGPLAGSTP
ncbi:acyl-CoA thioesterase [Streptomyces sp. RerS4]|uniref:acyl-CoA thioesterase n=1 Tax=Streptomyces sp. RerS4 TaxID=2942449 RepID=UPI00201BA141|nr:acyl-CoA thioesterase [Streptomyces sp. RerS4]UQX05364.1 acyl-CoA thioesterase [Streptomyces sp. RerS4]